MMITNDQCNQDARMCSLDGAAKSLQNLLRPGFFDKFITAEIDFYNKFIKSEESKEAHEYKFGLIEDTTESYGLLLRSLIPPPQQLFKNRICYFLPSIDSDLAHVSVLYKLLDEHSSQSSLKILVAGYACKPHSPRSELLRKLAADKKITLLGIPQSHEGLLYFMNLANGIGISQLVIYSVPHLMNTWVAALGAERVTWMPTKFELSCFKLLKNRVSTFGSLPQAVPESKVYWQRSKLFIPETFFRKNVAYNGINSKLGTINREEKIRNESFLDAVVTILDTGSDLSFYWTGRKSDASITEKFAVSGHLDKTFFLGWVDPDTALNEFSVFLDTPDLSGTVAAIAFANGIPTCSFRGANSWVEAFEQDFIDDPMINQLVDSRKSFLFDDLESYVKHALDLARDQGLALRQSVAQQFIAEKYMSGNMHDSYIGHIEIIGRLAEAATETSYLTSSCAA